MMMAGGALRHLAQVGRALRQAGLEAEVSIFISELCDLGTSAGQVLFNRSTASYFAESMK